MKIGDEKHQLSTDRLSEIAAAFAKVFTGTLDTALGAVAGTTIGLGASAAQCLVLGPQLVTDPTESMAMGGMALGAAAGACLGIIAQARHLHSVRLLEALSLASKDRPEVMEKIVPSVRLWEHETILGQALVLKPSGFGGGAGFSKPQSVTFALLLERCREHDFSCVNALIRSEVQALHEGARDGIDEVAQMRHRLEKVLAPAEQAKAQKNGGPR
jgi:hypothetical protein